MRASEKLDELVGKVEELLTQLPANFSPEVDALRDRVDTGIFDAWTSIAGRHDAQPRVGAQLWTVVALAFLFISAWTFATCGTRQQS
jgi:hypothetical protein